MYFNLSNLFSLAYSSTIFCLEESIYSYHLIRQTKDNNKSQLKPFVKFCLLELIFRLQTFFVVINHARNSHSPVPPPLSLKLSKNRKIIIISRAELTAFTRISSLRIFYLKEGLPKGTLEADPKIFICKSRVVAWTSTLIVKLSSTPETSFNFLKI